MFSLLEFLNDPSQQGFLILTLALASLRIFLEIIGFDFSKLPMTKKLSAIRNESMNKFHKMGLYFCIGHILFTAPMLLAS